MEHRVARANVAHDSSIFVVTTHIQNNSCAIFRLFITILFCLVTASIGESQPLPYKSSPNYDNDYFAVAKSDKDAYIRVLLQSVETHHIIPCPHDKGGVFADIAAGRYEYAYADMEYVLKYFPNHPKGLHLIGMIARTMNRPSLAIAYYQKALHLFPQYALTHLQFGSYLIDIAQTTPAIAELQKAIKLDPSLKMAYVKLAQAYVINGHTEKARQAADEARKLGYTEAIPGVNK